MGCSPARINKSVRFKLQTSDLEPKQTRIKKTSENFRRIRPSLKPAQITIQAFTQNQRLNQDLIFQKDQIKKKNEDLNYFRHTNSVNKRGSNSSFAEEDIDPMSIKSNFFI